MGERPTEVEATMKPRGPPSRVGIAILNYNCRELLGDCIKSVLDQTYPEIVTFVIDNGSDDGSAEMVTTEFPEVVLVPIRSNTGFAGLNLAFELALEQNCNFVMYLDSDAKLDSGAVSELVSYLERNPQCGIAGPLQLEYSTSRPYFIGATINFRTLRSRPAPLAQAPVDCDYLGNSLVRDEVLKYVRFDERFFTYYSDTDFCVRAKHLGFKITGVPAARLYSMERYTSSKVPGLRGFLSLRNRLLFASKHTPREAWPLVVGLSLIDSMARPIYFLVHGRFRDAALVFIGLASGLALLAKGKEPTVLRELAASGMRSRVRIPEEESNLS
jgi:GT2 family glycosyltransferase